MPVCALVSFRLGLTDGVSIVAARWGEILENLGFEIVTVAGEGPAQRIVPGLALGATEPPSSGQVESALADADLVVVENLCTIPMNLPASRAVARARASLPTVLHHHDPPWQRDRYRHITELPPTDGAWEHVSINAFTRSELAARGIQATTIRNPFDLDVAPGRRSQTRARLGLPADTPLLVHPVRAIERKNIPKAIEVATQLGAVYWLLGAAEEGYGPILEGILADASCPVLHHGWESIPDAYAASDLVGFPSLWEGFGNPPIEAAIHGRPAFVGDYPAARELRSLGFAWFDPDDIAGMDACLEAPDASMIENNRRLAEAHFSMAVIQRHVAALLDRRGWLP